MKDGTCQKCGSTEIYESLDGGGVGGREHALGIRNGAPLATYDWITYLCANCGFYENYLLDKKMLSAVVANPAKAGWKKTGA